MYKIIKEPNNEVSFIMYIPNILSKSEINNLQTWLNMNEKFIRDKTKREQIWYQENGKYFVKEWYNRYPRWKSNNYDNFLKNFQQKIQKNIGKINLDYPGIIFPKINSCLINKYKNGNDYIKAHRDTSLSFGTNPTIVGISVGEEREIKFTRIKYDEKKLKSLKKDIPNSHLNFSIKLESNSMLIMAGATQKYFCHEIPNSEATGKRYSLTFREYLE